VAKYYFVVKGLRGPLTTKQFKGAIAPKQHLRLVTDVLQKHIENADIPPQKLAEFVSSTMRPP
jgi:hypothetical protein